MTAQSQDVRRINAGSIARGALPEVSDEGGLTIEPAAEAVGQWGYG